MSASVGRLIRCAVLTAAAWLVATSAFAQFPHPLPEAPVSTDFLSRFDWKMSGAYLSNPDPRFKWDAHWAGDVDLFSYRGGRATVLADYNALLGHEYSPFDPYQSNYLLEASGSFFFGRTEIAGVFSHLSRHLGDRPKRVSVAENSFGPRVMRRFGDDARTSWDIRADVRKVVAESYDDYSWIEEFELVRRRQLNPHTGLYARAYSQLIQVSHKVLGRGQQAGGRLEAGVKLTGSKPEGAALELFGGWERMIDADPLDRRPRQWAYLGFRVLGN